MDYGIPFLSFVIGVVVGMVALIGLSIVMARIKDRHDAEFDRRG